MCFTRIFAAPWLVTIDAPGEGGGDPTESSGAPPEKPAKGYPEGVPVSDMTDTEQAAYWKAQARKHEERAKQAPTREELAALRGAAAELDQVKAAAMSDQEKAVAVAREEGRQAALDEANANAADTIMRASLSARGLDADEITSVMIPLDVRRFIGEGGDIDIEAIHAYAERLTGSQATKTRAPDMGQGRRGQTGKITRSGEDLVEQFGL